MFLEAEDEQTPRNLNERSCHYNIIKINNEVSLGPDRECFIKLLALCEDGNL